MVPTASSGKDQSSLPAVLRDDLSLLKMEEEFVFNDYHITLGNLIIELKEGYQDPYDILSSYISYLQNEFL